MTPGHRPDGDTSFQPRPAWTAATRRNVMILVAVAFALLLWRARDVLGPFVWGGILADVFNPAAGWISRAGQLPRGASVALVFALVLGLPTLATDNRFGWPR